jgi:hypothetical protein
MTNHLALIKNERRHEYRRRLIAVEKSWRDAQGAILFGKASRKAAFATNDSECYWRRSGARQSGGRRATFWRSHGPPHRGSAKALTLQRLPSRAIANATQEFVKPRCRMVGDAAQPVGKPSLRIDEPSSACARPDRPSRP